MTIWTADVEYLYTFVNLDDNPKTLNITVVPVPIPPPPQPDDPSTSSSTWVVLIILFTVVGVGAVTFFMVRRRKLQKELDLKEE